MEHSQPDNQLVSAYSLTEKPAIELETVQKAMQGDKEAFSALFMQTYRTMFLVVRRFLARDEDIYDALQNGYTKAYKYLPAGGLPHLAQKDDGERGPGYPRRYHRLGNSLRGYGGVCRRADGG